jgi:soluble lytic murein transglycosylase-like protein
MNKKHAKFLIFIFPVFSFMMLGFTLSQEHVSTDKTMADMNSYINVNRSMINLDVDRQTSLNKIKDIISRYNKDMGESKKQEIANEIYLMSNKYPNLNIDFICATITHESAKTWNPKITSRVGARGLMQIMPQTGAFLAVEEGVDWKSAKILYEPITNIRLGCRYLSDMVEMYDEDGGLAAYNGGPRRAKMWLAANRNNRVLFAETRNYIPAVMKLYEEFRSTEQL